MRKPLVLVGLFLLMTGVVFAQDFPRVETSPAFMYIRTPISFGGFSQSLNCAGAGGTIAYNFTSLIGLAADMGGCKFFGDTLGSAGVGVSGNQFTFLFGPRFTFRNSTPFVPFVEGNFGGDRISLSCNNGLNPCSYVFPYGGSVSKTAFAMTWGGGFDIKLNKKISIRAVQAEYLYTRFGNECGLSICGNNNNQNSFRLKSGIVIAWGGGSK